MVVVVFGARGNVGRHVADGLLAAGEKVRAISRTPAAGLTAGLDAVGADLDRPETLPAVLDGADKMFLYGMLDPQRPYDIEKVVAAAAAAGIRQVVLLSSVSVLDTDADHPVPRLNRAIEQAVQRSGLDWTFLRPGTFATNTRTWWAGSNRPDRTGPLAPDLHRLRGRVPDSATPGRAHRRGHRPPHPDRPRLRRACSRGSRQDDASGRGRSDRESVGRRLRRPGPDFHHRRKGHRRAGAHLRPMGRRSRRRLPLNQLAASANTSHLTSSGYVRFA